MKKQSKIILSLTVALCFLVTTSLQATASNGTFTITVNPIKVLVNNEVFVPKDVNGEKVMMFTCNGTTYVPLRAISEAYGLEVGYDKQQGMVTINSNSDIITQNKEVTEDFTSLWDIKQKPVTNYGNEVIFTANYSGNLNLNDFKIWWKSLTPNEINEGAEQLVKEVQDLAPNNKVTMYFSYKGYSLGTAYSQGGSQMSNFKVANDWIK